MTVFYLYLANTFIFFLFCIWDHEKLLNR